jgi:hypothetical protein
MTTTNRRIAGLATLIAAPALIMVGTGTAWASTDLTSLVPTPANTQRTDGPNAIRDGGINEHFQVNGAPSDVMSAYQGALQNQGWNVTVVNAGRNGSTFTGTNGAAYGVFTGGGYGTTTNIQACAWPTMPANPHCG